MNASATANQMLGNNRCPRRTLAGRNGGGRFAGALLLSPSFLMNQCNGDSNKPSSSGSAGGANTGQGGETSVGGHATGGVLESGGARIGGSTGGGATAGAGGYGGTPRSASTGTYASGGVAGDQGGGIGGTSFAGGGSSSNTALGGVAATGGIIGTGGSLRVGGTTDTGGGSSVGGNTSTGGNTNTANVTTAGGSAGGVGAAGGAAGTGGSSSKGGTMSTPETSATSGKFTLTSPGWTNVDGCGPTNKTVCPPLPTEIIRSGAGTSPELHWTGVPEGTKSFVVVLQDLNNGTAHWILWNIPATATMLSANVDQKTATPATPAGSQQCGKGTDAATTDGYYGPGAPCNCYEFMVYALSIATFSPSNATDQESVRTQLQALGASILGTASLRGRTNQGC
jgi:Raf kinase inhibitor-like YbhB/YbcL family protein